MGETVKHQVRQEYLNLCPKVGRIVVLHSLPSVGPISPIKFVLEL